MTLRVELLEAFSSAGLTSVNPDILGKCLALASSHRVSPTQMAESWEAYSLNKNVTELTETTFQPFRNAVVKDMESSGSSAPTMTTSPSTAKDGAVVTRRPGMGKRQVPPNMVTPPPPHKQSRNDGKSAVDAVARGNGSPSPTSAAATATKRVTTMPKYNERTDVGKVIVSYNPHKLEASSEISAETESHRRCVINNQFDTNVSKPYRHMFTTLDDRSKALDHHLVTMGEEIANRYNIDKSSSASSGEGSNDNSIAPLESVGIPRQDLVCCIGRVCNEAHEGRINATSVVLEGSRHGSGGARVNVDLSLLKEKKTSYSLFPGQIVAVEGMNSSGRKLVAHRICEGAAHVPNQSSVSDLMKFHHDDEYQGGKPLKIITTCGPYTTSDSMTFEPLLDLMHVVQADKPDVVILCGPFVDLKQELIQSGNTMLEVEEEDGSKILVPYEMFFANKVAVMMEDLFESDPDLQTQFVLVPSLDDANAEWVYPQAPFGDRLKGGGKSLKLPGANGLEYGTLGLHHIETSAGGRTKKNNTSESRVHLVSNPSTIQVNEVVLGITSTDTLMHINTDETSANLAPGSRLGRIAQHLLQQRSYYPLFPPSPQVNLDLKRMNQWSMPRTPDILIVPSKLTCFARSVLDSTVVLNPGRLTRETTGGNYAVMDIHPMKRETLENAGGSDIQMEHRVHDRIRVDIKRI